jgi:hypothetical protein
VKHAADNFELLISLQLPLAPMYFFAIGLELAHHVSLQLLHCADACKHCRSAEIGDEQERPDRNLPCSAILDDLLELENKGARIGSGNELPATRQRNGIIEFARPTTVADAATLSCRVR